MDTHDDASLIPDFSEFLAQPERAPEAPVDPTCLSFPSHVDSSALRDDLANETLLFRGRASIVVDANQREHSSVNSASETTTPLDVVIENSVKEAARGLTKSLHRVKGKIRQSVLKEKPSTDSNTSTAASSSGPDPSSTTGGSVECSLADPLQQELLVFDRHILVVESLDVVDTPPKLHVLAVVPVGELKLASAEEIITLIYDDDEEEDPGSTAAVSLADSRVLVSLPDPDTLKVWFDAIWDAVHAYHTTFNPQSTALPGWMHEYLPGTIFAAALDGNWEELNGLLMDANIQAASVALADDDQDNLAGQLVHGAPIRLSPSVHVNSIDASGATALHYAALRGNVGLVDQLLASDADPNSLDNNLWTPIHYACVLGHCEVVPALVRAGCDVNMCDLKDRTALFQVVIQCSKTSLQATEDIHRFVKFVDVLIKSGVNPERRDVNHETALELACKIGSVAMVRSLLDGHSHPSARGSLGRTPLHVACVQEDPKPHIVGELLSWGSAPNARDEDQNTPLNLLLRGDTPLQDGSRGKSTSSAATFPTMNPNRTQCAAILVAGGARTDIANKKNQTPNDAARYQNISFVDAIEQWKKRKAPSVVLELAQKSLVSLPLAIGQSHRQWEKDSAISACNACALAFNFTNRRHHCRVCGKIFCDQCRSKSFLLCTTETSKSGVGSFGSTTGKLCAACFNNACRLVTMYAIEMNNSEDAGPTPTLDKLLGKKSEAQQRGELLGNAETAEQDAQVTEDNQTQKVASQSERVHEALEKARNRLVEREDKLNNLANESEKLNDNAQNFAKMARELRQQQEKDNCVVS